MAGQWTAPRGVLVTGATGQVGARIIERLLDSTRDTRVYALVDSAGSASALRPRLQADAARVTFVAGDVTRAGAGLDAAMRARLAGNVNAIVHSAEDAFARRLEDARAINTAGTRNVLELADEWGVERFVHLSTAFVAGAHVGPIAESMLSDAAGFVNGYEQSKYEAELLVRAAGTPWVIVRPSVIISDDVRGAVTHQNAVHRALRVVHAGLCVLMPGADDTPLDLVTASHVADGTVGLGLGRDGANVAYHLCAGTGAIALGELLDTAFAIWSRDPAWRRRGIMRPALTDLARYRLFERSVEEIGDVRLSAITRLLSRFVPQLALPKLFDTRLADAMLGRSAAPVPAYWSNVVEHLTNVRWGVTRSAA